MTTRYREGRSLVISMIALARSLSGIVPHALAIVASFFSSTAPLPAPPMIALSGAGLLDRVVPAPIWLPPPFGQQPPLHCPPLHWFSFSLISSSRRKTIFFWMSWVVFPPGGWLSRRSELSISRRMLDR